MLNRNVLEVSEIGDSQQPYFRLTVVVTKAEWKMVLKLVYAAAPHAFVIMDKHIHINGWFMKPI